MVKRTLKNWPWIIVSVVVCTGLGFLYALSKTPSYTKEAAIVIRNDQNGNTLAGNLSQFADMGLIQTYTNLLDEVNKLKSTDYMADVVKRLDISTNYVKKGTFHDDVLYGSKLPIKVTFSSLNDTQDASCTLDISKDGTITIKDLEFKGEPATVTPTECKFGQTVKTSFGPMIITKTPFFKPGEDMVINVSKMSLYQAANAYAAKFLIEIPDEKANTVFIKVVDYSPQRAEDIINTLIAVYNEKWMEAQNKIVESTTKFINDRLGMIESELGSVDQNISSYQSEHLIPNIGEAASMAMSESQAASAQILGLNNQLQMSRYLKSYITEGTSTDQVLPANSGIGNAAIEAQIAKYNEVMIQRNRLGGSNAANHPVILELDAQLAAMRSAILSSVDNQIVSLTTQINNIQGSRARANAQIAATPTQAKYLLSVERQQKVKESLYLYLLQKREENELSQAFTAYNTEIISQANGENSPTSPKKSRILMMAFLVGLFIPFGVTFVVETNNNKVKGRKDIESLNIPFMGEIPSTRHRKGEDPNTIVRVGQGRRNVINEAFRVLRTNLGFMTANDKHCSVIMLTSFNPNSGKTFISVNLGISLALQDKRVLLIDGDLRRCSTSKYVNSPSKGISDYLIGKSDNIDDYIKHNALVDNLDILPVGTVPPNPIELLESDRFAKLIEGLRERYDYILIDCPPSEIMADVRIIGQLVDRTLFVIRTGVFERAKLPELQNIYNEHKYKNMSLILNGVGSENSSYFEYSHYATDKD